MYLFELLVSAKLGIDIEIQGDSDEASAWKEKRDSMQFSDYESEPEAELQEVCTFKYISYV